jgi:hypothetical protein
MATVSSRATTQSALLEKFSSNMTGSSGKRERLYSRPDRAEKGQLTPAIGATRARWTVDCARP